MSNYRLGLDLGSNSIGWCAIELDSNGNPCGVLDAGVRILTPNEEAGRDPTSKSSLAASRRIARSARRRRDRFVRRRDRLMSLLVENGLMPHKESDRKELEKIDPYWLRQRALDKKLELHEIGRAIFHINQRRGYRSNRIADADNDEKSSMKMGIQELRQKLEYEGCRTIGEFLARRHNRDKDGHRIDSSHPPLSIRFRPVTEKGGNIYEFYPTREMVEHELNEILQYQKQFHPTILTDELQNRLNYLIIQQRPLKPQDIGRCTFRPARDIDSSLGFDIDLGERAPKAHPLFQKFRILQNVNQLRISRPGMQERQLTCEESAKIVSLLESRRPRVVEFTKLREELNLPEDARLNYERTERKGFTSDETARLLANKTAFGAKKWKEIPSNLKIECVERLIQIQNDDELRDWIINQFNVTEEQAECISEVKLVSGHAHLGRSMLRDLVDAMSNESTEGEHDDVGQYQRYLSYDESVDRIGLHHSHHSPDLKDLLPYYGSVLPNNVISRSSAAEGSQERIGRVPNPTVHIALNQIRLIINLLIVKYGKPAEAVVELARELKLSKKQKDKINKKNKENQEKNAKYVEELRKLGLENTARNRLRMRLYYDLPAHERVCVYSGEVIPVHSLFSGNIEIDHILPYSKTLDDSIQNKVLCTRSSNQLKGNSPPSDAWTGEKLQEIAERAERVVPGKSWRFAPDAMTKFGEESDFLQRQLHDTQHVSRLARTYLQHICARVSATPGRLTAMLRGKWGLNSILLPDHIHFNTSQPKNRKDHRHHAIDAFVVACTDIGLLNRISRESARAERLDLDRLFPKDSFPTPFENFRTVLEEKVNSLIVSHKPDHGLSKNQSKSSSTSGQLLEKTAYGLIREEVNGTEYNLVYRQRVENLTENGIRRIRDNQIRNDLLAHVKDGKNRNLPLNQSLIEFSERTGIRRVRVLKKKGNVREIVHGNKFRKTYVLGNNHRIEIYETPDGEWKGEGVSVFDANQADFTPKWKLENPEAKLAIRAHNGDLIEADFGKGLEIFKVCQLRPSASLLVLAKHNEGGSLDKRHEDKADSFQYKFASYPRLKQANAIRVIVDPIGQVQRMGVYN